MVNCDTEIICVVSRSNADNSLLTIKLSCRRETGRVATLRIFENCKEQLISEVCKKIDGNCLALHNTCPCLGRDAQVLQSEVGHAQS